MTILLTQIPGGDLLRTTMSPSTLFAQPWRAAAEFVTEQRELGCRAGQLEASTAMPRALFDVNGQLEVLLGQLDTTSP